MQDYADFNTANTFPANTASSNIIIHSRVIFSEMKNSLVLSISVILLFTHIDHY